MVDNRSAGFFGIGGAFNFKSGDISGTAAKMSDDKMGQGGEYFAQQKGDEEEFPQGHEKYMDRSAVLRATLNSLAMMNVANVINAKKIAMQNNAKNKNSAPVNKHANSLLDEEDIQIMEHIDDIVD